MNYNIYTLSNKYVIIIELQFSLTLRQLNKLVRICDIRIQIVVQIGIYFFLGLLDRTSELDRPD